MNKKVTQDKNKGATKAAVTRGAIAKKRAIEEEDSSQETSTRKKTRGNTPMVDWDRNPELTEALLDYIESHQVTRIALKFSRGDGGTAAGGDKQTAHHQRIAEEILIKHDSGNWATVDKAILGGIIKNRLSRMCQHYGSWKSRLENTGEGLKDDDPNEYSNLIQTRDAKFPCLIRKDTKKKFDADGEEMEDSDGMEDVDDTREKTKGKRSDKGPFTDIMLSESDDEKLPNPSTSSFASVASTKSAASDIPKISTKSNIPKRPKGMLDVMSRYMELSAKARQAEELELTETKLEGERRIHCEVAKIEATAKLEAAKLEMESKERLERKRLEFEFQLKLAEIKGKEKSIPLTHFNPNSSTTPGIAPEFVGMDLSMFSSEGYGQPFSGPSTQQ